MPHLDQTRVEVHNPIDGDSRALITAALRDPIETRRRGGEHLGDEDRNAVVLPLDRLPLTDHGAHEQVRLHELAGSKIQIGRRDHGVAEPLGPDIRIDEAEQLDDRSLMTSARTRAHEQFAVDKLVPLPVLGQGEHLFAGPMAGDVRHDHMVRSAAGGKQGGIS